MPSRTHSTTTPPSNSRSSRSRRPSTISAILQNSTFPNLSATLQNQAAQSRNYSGAYSIIGATQNNSFRSNTAEIGTNATVNLAGNGLIEMAADAHWSQAKYSLTNAENRWRRRSPRFYSVIKNAASSKWTSRRSDTRTRRRRRQGQTPRGNRGARGRHARQISWYQTSSNLAGAQADEENARETRTDHRRAADDAVRLTQASTSSLRCRTGLRIAPDRRVELAARRALGARIAGCGPPDAQDVGARTRALGANQRQFR